VVQQPDAPAAPPAAPTPPSRDLGGATQYFKAVDSEAQALVGVLVGIQGPLKGQIYKINDGENQVGRERCEVLLADPTKRISRFHAKITHMEGALVIEANPEVMEKNPTYLNDDAIDAEALSDGDILRFGDCTFKFRTI
jgi:pSer/pThr/pTyr-binding forkhead associated (FHA) protein